MIKRTTVFTILLILISVISALLISEVALRLLSHKDIDGNIYIGNLQLSPFSLPVENLKLKAQIALEKKHSYIQYDPDLGWSVRPSSRSENGLYASNAAGVRTANVGQEITPTVSPGILRIAIFGDSFTHGDDVPLESTWGAILENALNQKGIKAEVLNLGGPGYGMDQAFLRWRKNGKPLNPHIVLFGFQSSNIKRNMNIIRMLYSPDTGIPYSKPRFILLSGNNLHLANSPSVKPEEILEIFSDFTSWNLSAYEFFFQEVNYIRTPWHSSRLAALVISGLTHNFSARRQDFDYYAEGSTSRQLTERIIEEFHSEVTGAQSRFIIIHLPTKRPLRNRLKGNPLEYQDLFDTLHSKYDIIDPTDGLIAQSKEDAYEDLFAENSSHYSHISNRVIGEWIAAQLVINR